MKSGPQAVRAMWRLASRLTIVGYLAVCVWMTAVPAKAAEGASQPGPTLTGTALVGGVPAAGVVATLEAWESPWEAANRRLGGKARSTILAEGTSAADGRFALLAPRPGNYRLVLEAPDGATLFARRLALALDEELGAIELVRAKASLVDATEGDLLLSITSPGRWARTTFEATAEKKVAGRGRTKHQPGGKGSLALVGQPGQLPRTCLVEAAVPCRFRAPTATVPVELRVQQAGEPIAEALVVEARSGWPLARSAKDGRVTVPIAREGSTELAVLGRDLSRTILGLSAPPPPQTAQIQAETKQLREVELEAARQVRVRVVDDRSGAPVAGAAIGSFDGPFVSSDAAGWATVATGDAELWLEISAPDRVRWVGGVATSGDQTVRLLAGARLVGRVVDANGKGVAGVDLALEPQINTPLSPFPDRRAARTGADGRFVVPRLDPRCDWELRARPHGHPPARALVTGLAAGRDTNITLELVAGLAAEVMVVDEDELPIAGAAVSLMPDPRQPHDETDPLGQAVTDISGRARLKGLGPTRDAVLAVSAPDFAATRVPGIEIPAASEALELEGVTLGTVTLAPEAPIEVLVTTRDDLPIEGALIWAVATEEEVMALRMGRVELDPVATTDATGIAVVGGFGPGDRAELVARAAGYSPEVTTVEAGAPGLPKFSLSPLLEVSGVVYDEQGDPLPGADVWLSLSIQVVRKGGYGYASAGGRSARSDEDGAFLFDAVEVGSGSLVASMEGRQRARLELALRPGEKLEGLELLLLPGATVTGVVRDAKGAPVTGARVTVESASAMSGEEGKFRLEAVPIGPAQLFAGASGFVTRRMAVEVELGETAVEVELERGLELSGRVVDDGGEPLGGTELRPRLLSSEGYAPSVESDAQGAFVLRDLEPGELQIEVLSFGRTVYASEPILLTADLEGYELVVPRGTRLEGRLLDVELADLAGAQVVASTREAWGRMAAGAVDFEGRYSVDGVRPGSWRVSAQLRDGRRGHVEIEVEPGVERIERNIELSRGAVLWGRVLVDGEPLSQLAVVAQHPHQGQAGRAVTDAEGRFELTGLEPGPLELVISRERTGLRFVRAALVEERQDDELLIEITTGSIAGRVLDATGDPILAARLELVPAEEEFWFANVGRATSGLGGRFELPTVAAGSWRLRTNAPGFAQAIEQIELAEGEHRTDLEVVLEAEAALTFRVNTNFGSLERVFVGAIDLETGQVVFEREVPAASDGTVRVPLPPGRYEILTGRVAFTGVVSFEAVAPAELGIVHLPPPTFAAIVVDPTSVPPGERLELRAFDAAGKLLHYVTSSRVLDALSWTIQLAQIPLRPGTARLELRSSGGQVWAGEVEPLEGGNISVVLEPVD